MSARFPRVGQPVKRFRMACFLGFTAVIGCSSPPPNVEPREPPTVTAAHPVKKKLQPWLKFNGRAEAVNAVDVVPEVTGES